MTDANATSTAWEMIPVVNPATGERIGEIPVGGAAEVEAAVAAAHGAGSLQPGLELRCTYILEGRKHCLSGQERICVSQ